MEKTVTRLLAQAKDSTQADTSNLEEVLGLLKSDHSLITLECIQKVAGLLSLLKSASDLVVYFMSIADKSSIPAETQDVCLKGIIASGSIGICSRVYRYIVSPGNRNAVREFVKAGTTHTDLV
jgi:hypothetical protein